MRVLIPFEYRTTNEKHKETDDDMKTKTEH